MKSFLLELFFCISLASGLEDNPARLRGQKTLDSPRLNEEAMTSQWGHISRQLQQQIPLSEVVAQAFIFQLMEAYIGFGKLLREINGNERKTLFVPWDLAWKNLSPTIIAKLQSESWGAHLQDLILHHIVDGDIMPGSFAVQNETFTSRNAEDIVIGPEPNDTGVRVNGAAAFTNYEATDGVLWMLDKVIMPGWVGRTLLNLVTSRFSVLTSLVERVGYDIALGDPAQKLTILAPDDAAFERLGPLMLNFLMSDVGLPVLENVLEYHVLIDGPYPSMYFRNRTLPTLYDETLRLTISDSGPPRITGIGNEANIILADQVANNGKFSISCLLGEGLLHNEVFFLRTFSTNLSFLN